ncbi:MAG: methionine synthase [Candidatus Omnitrophica bacterium]|nr:methionine synthase [Candidatus Omnitrophota bacterium]
MKDFSGLATGIGSLPHKDADSALDLIFKYVPEIPFWPQLPKRDHREGMVQQFSEHMPFLRLKGSDVAYLTKGIPEGELETFYERIIEADTDYFQISEDYSKGIRAFIQRLEKADLSKISFLKCNITGPFTFAASFKDEKGVSLLHDAVFLQACLKGLAMKAIWQIKLLRRFAKKLIVFIDEPYLGCFGSAYTPLNRPEVIAGLSEMASDIKAGDVLLGVHCCGNTDWSIFTDTPGIDIINFDAYGYLDKVVLYADNLKGFLKRGGILCWGVAPTDAFDGSQTPEMLVAKISEGINILAKKGIDRDLLSENLLISPACGLGSLDLEKAEGILRLLSETSFLLRKIS